MSATELKNCNRFRPEGEADKSPEITTGEMLGESRVYRRLPGLMGPIEGSIFFAPELS